MVVSGTGDPVPGSPEAEFSSLCLPKGKGEGAPLPPPPTRPRASRKHTHSHPNLAVPLPRTLGGGGVPPPSCFWKTELCLPETRAVKAA